MNLLAGLGRLAVGEDFHACAVCSLQRMQACKKYCFCMTFGSLGFLVRMLMDTIMEDYLFIMTTDPKKR
jgi:hypothetical protein